MKNKFLIQITILWFIIIFFPISIFNTKIQPVNYYNKIQSQNHKKVIIIIINVMTVY